MPPSQPQQDQALKKYRKWALLAIIVFVVLLVFLWWIGRSFIEVTVDSDSSSEITYRFVNQANNQTTEVKDASKNIKKTLSKGEYELTVTQDKKGYFSVAKTGENIKVTPESEKGRRFVGNEPRPCVQLVEVILLSYDCGGGMNTLQTHQPATNSLPTLTKVAFPFVEDVIEGTVHTQAGQDIIVIREAEVAGHEEFEGPEHASHTAMVMQGTAQGVTFTTPTPLPALAEQDGYRLIAYRDGFIAYDESINQLFNYQKLGEPPVKLPVENLNSDDLRPRAITTKGNEYAVTYERAGEEGTVVVVHTNDKPRRYDFDKTFTTVRLCGDQKLCGMTEDGWLEVHDISANDKPKLLYLVSNVSSIENMRTGKDLIVVRNDEIVKLNIESGSGPIQYTFGEYSFCGGLQPTSDSYTICIENKDGTKSILVIDQQQTSDDIDQKVAELSSIKEVKNISIYGDFIFVTPDAGAKTFSRETDGYTYNPDQVKKANDKITQTVEKLGIDQNKYKIKRTIQ